MNVTFTDYVAQALGSTRWVVARRSDNLAARGYEAFVSPKAFAALKIAWQAAYPAAGVAYFGAH